MSMNAHSHTLFPNFVDVPPEHLFGSSPVPTFKWLLSKSGSRVPVFPLVVDRPRICLEYRSVIEGYVVVRS